MNFRSMKLVIVLGMSMMFASCTSIAPRVVNLTPQLMPTNPSGIYTISLKVDGSSDAKDISAANVVIGGSIFPMVKSQTMSNLFTFDYSIPSSINRARYYFEILNSKGEIRSKSEIYDLNLTNRYVVELESSRAKPGAAISVLGKGFRDTDHIQFGGSTLETRYISDNQLVFNVPAKDGGKDYQVALETSGGAIPIGKFRVDYSELRSMPSRVILLEGQSMTIVFTIDEDAPPDGVDLEFSPSSPDLLEVGSAQIEAGQRSTNVQVTGGMPGEGTLVVSAAAHNQLVLQVRVDSRNGE